MDNKEFSELYVKIGLENESGFDLNSLSEVFSGLDGVIKELHSISNINGELKLKVTKVEEGSVILTLGAEIISSLPFEKIPDLLNFLFVTAPDLYKQANSFFNEINGVHKSLNDFVNTHGFDVALVTLFLEKFVPKMIKLAPKYKNNPIILEEDRTEIPEVYAKRLHDMVVTKKFRKVALPVAEEKIKYVSFGATKDQLTTSIDNSNFEGYLSEDEKILPEWNNGQQIKLTGEVVALQSTQGETLKFKAIGIPHRYSLFVAIPTDGKSSEDYVQYYKKQVAVNAEIFRSSVYKKPKLIIKDIELLQTKML